MATIDKNSITVTKTADVSVYKVDFDFTDSTSLNVDQGWLVPWLHTSFMAGSTATTAEFNAGAVEAMKIVRRPTPEFNFETSLRSNYGVVVIRSNPAVSTEFQKFELASVSTDVVIRVTT